MASLQQILTQTGKGTLRFGKLFRQLYFSPFQSCCKHVTDKQISSSSRALKILSESTTIAQDGVTIEELPILIRKVNRDSFPFTSHSYSGDNVREESDFDATFKEMLQDCDSVNAVFNLLEVPSDKVQGHSAVYALQRLHVLMSLNTDWQQIHSFIRRAVIGELYQIVERDIKLLSNFSLISLIDCYFAAEGFSTSCFDVVNEEISHRLVEGLLSIEELLSLVQSLKSGILSNQKKMTEGNIRNNTTKNSTLKDILSENASVFLSFGKSDRVELSPNSHISCNGYFKCQELLRNAWIHLASRFADLDENTLPWTMQLLSSENRTMIPKLDKQLTHLWPQLSAETAAMCLDNLARLRANNQSMMTKLGQWAFVNIHLMTPAVLLSFLNVYLQFSFSDSNFINVMERCISKTGIDTPTDLLALCVEHLRLNRFVSPIVMDVAADHFVQHWESYNPLEIFAVLRSFGQLSYLPPKSQEFLFKTELCLHKRFDVMNEAHLLEVLASFTFVDVLPRNFYKRVTSDYFYKKVGALKNPTRTTALMWLKIMKHAVVFGGRNDPVDRHLQWVMDRKKRWSIFLYQDTEKVAIANLKSALDQLFGPDYHHVIPFYSCCAVYIDKQGMPLKVTRTNGFPQPDGIPAHRLVILLRSANHFTTNTRQLLGAQSQRLAHLTKLGFLPLEIRVGEFLCQPGTSVLKDRLSPFIDFQKPEVRALEAVWMTKLEEKYLKDWMDSHDPGDEGESPDDSDGELPSNLNFDLNTNDRGFYIPPSNTPRYGGDEVD